MHLHLIHTCIQVFELLYVAVYVVHFLRVADHIVLHVLELALEFLHAEHHALYAVVQQLFLQQNKMKPVVRRSSKLESGY